MKIGLCIIHIFFLFGNVVLAASNTNLSKAYIANNTIRQLSEALKQFKRDVGRYPYTDEGLKYIIERPSGIEGNSWNGPYLNSSELPLDPWRKPYHYEFPGKNNKQGFDLFSYGMDGLSKSNGNDDNDINNWDIDNKWKNYYEPIFSVSHFLFLLIVLLIILVFQALNSFRKYLKGEK